MNKKKSVPRHKKLNRQSRLSAAKIWISKYTGKKIVKSYAKHFGVDLVCAIKELTILNYPLDIKYCNQIKKNTGSTKKKQLQVHQELQNLTGEEYYGFSYIADYTSGGFPYGIRMDEVNDTDFSTD